MIFTILHERLVGHLRQRVRAGEVTERSLARITGMSQPHLHNVLKGIRSLSSEYADRIVQHLNLSVLDLLTAEEIGIPSDIPDTLTAFIPKITAVPSLGRVDSKDKYPVPLSLIASLVEPVMVQLGYDSKAYPFFQEGDFALIDQRPLTRAGLQAESVYLIKQQGGAVVRSVRVGGTRLYLLTPDTMGEPRHWEWITLSGHDLGTTIAGRVVWIGRQTVTGQFQAPAAI